MEVSASLINLWNEFWYNFKCQHQCLTQKTYLHSPQTGLEINLKSWNNSSGRISLLKSFPQFRCIIINYSLQSVTKGFVLPYFRTTLRKSLKYFISLIWCFFAKCTIFYLHTSTYAKHAYNMLAVFDINMFKFRI